MRSLTSSTIKYLTQSTWSHTALYVGNVIEPAGVVGDRPTLIEADASDGVRVVPFSRYAHYHTRISRPVGLKDRDTTRVYDYMILRLGYQYDVRNVVDLARYLIQTPPVPGAGSGACSRPAISMCRPALTSSSRGSRRGSTIGRS